jgi:hypothetical protein
VEVGVTVGETMVIVHRAADSMAGLVLVRKATILILYVPGVAFAGTNTEKVNDELALGLSKMLFEGKISVVQPVGTFWRLILSWRVSVVLLFLSVLMTDPD